MEANTKESYFIIYSWMPKLGLRGTALGVYAVIYSFTERGQTWRGSCSTLAERVGATRSNANRALAALVNRGLVKRVREERKGHEFPEYVALKPEEGCAETAQGCAETAQGLCRNDTEVVPKQHRGCAETAHNNKEDNKDHKKETVMNGAQGGYRSAGNACGGYSAYRRDRTNRPYNRALNYKQREYTAEDLKRMGIDLGEDVYNEDPDEH